MGKASSAKKVARAARAGGTRRPGQRRPIGFPLAVGMICVLGISLIVFARNQRAADAFPRANQDHVHSAYDIFTCVTAGSAGGETTTTTTPGETTSTTAPGETTSTTATGDPTATSDTTATTAPGDTTSTTAPGDTTTTTAPGQTTGTTTLAPGDAPGQFQSWLQDAQQDVLGIHTHGDGLIHIHPFTNSAAGVNANLGKFLDQTGTTLTNTSLRLPDGTTFNEGTTKCADGKDGELQVAKWNSADEAAKGNKPNQVFTEGFDKIRLGQNQVFVIAFMPAGSTFKSKDDVAQRIKTVSDVAPASDSGASSDTTPQPSVSVSIPPNTGSSDTGMTAPGATPSTDSSAPPASSSSP